MEQRLKISQARIEFADVIGRARYGRQATVLTDRGKDAAVVISPEAYRDYLRLKEEEDRRLVRDAIARVEAGEPMRVFTDPDQMRAAADADRAARGAA